MKRPFFVVALSFFASFIFEFLCKTLVNSCRKWEISPGHRRLFFSILNAVLKKRNWESCFCGDWGFPIFPECQPKIMCQSLAFCTTTFWIRFKRYFSLLKKHSEGKRPDVPYFSFEPNDSLSEVMNEKWNILFGCYLSIGIFVFLYTLENSSTLGYGLSPISRLSRRDFCDKSNIS